MERYTMIMGWKTQYGKDVNVSQFYLEMWCNSTENTEVYLWTMTTGF